MRADYTKQYRNLKQHALVLVHVAEGACKALDAEMKKPSNNERGARVAEIVNALEFAKDQTKHFGLGLPLGKPSPKPRP